MTSRRSLIPEAAVPPGPLTELVARGDPVRPGEIDRARRILEAGGLAPADVVAAALLSRTAEAMRFWRPPRARTGSR